MQGNLVQQGVFFIGFVELEVLGFDFRKIKGFVLFVKGIYCQRVFNGSGMYFDLVGMFGFDLEFC